LVLRSVTEVPVSCAFFVRFSRELGVPAIVGCSNITELLQEGQIITVFTCER
jgi:phosphohistidine swiveling domain-containing protein